MRQKHGAVRHPAHHRPAYFINHFLMLKKKKVSKIMHR